VIVKEAAVRSRTLLAVGVGVLVVGALLLNPLAVAGATDAPSAPPNPVDRFAEELGVTREQLDEAFRTVVDEQLTAAVEDGRISERRADRLRERLDELGFADFLRRWDPRAACAGSAGGSPTSDREPRRCRLSLFR